MQGYLDFNFSKINERKTSRCKTSRYKTSRCKTSRSEVAVANLAVSQTIRCGKRLINMEHHSSIFALKTLYHSRPQLKYPLLQMAGTSNQPDNKSFDDLIDDVLLGDLDQSDNMSLDEWIEDFMFDDSDERQLQLILEKYKQNSSSKSRRTLDRDREAGHERLFSDYFASNPVYPAETFR